MSQVWVSKIETVTTKDPNVEKQINEKIELIKKYEKEIELLLK